MSQAEPVKRVVDRRESGADTEAPLQHGLEFGERSVRGRRDEPAQVALMRLEHAATITRHSGPA